MSHHPSLGGIALLFSDDHHCTKLTHDVVSSISSHFPLYQKEADAAVSSRRTVEGCLPFSSLA
jgi:hypothetical protein